MAKPPKAFDVWFVVANTVYKGVPYNVVADWAQQGRLAATDMVRPAGTNVAWATVAEHEFLSDYLPRPAAATAVPPQRRSRPSSRHAVATAPPAAPAELPDPEELTYRGPSGRGRRRGGHDPAHRHQHGAARLLHHDPGRRVRCRSGRRAGDEVRGATHQRPGRDHDQHREAERGGRVLLGPRRARARRSRITTASTPGEGDRGARTNCSAGVQRPPEVRIACRKDLPYQRVVELQARTRSAAARRATSTTSSRPWWKRRRSKHVRGSAMSAWLVRQEGSPDAVSVPSEAEVLAGLARRQLAADRRGEGAGRHASGSRSRATRRSPRPRPRSSRRRPSRRTRRTST